MKKLNPVEDTGARAMQIIADNHPERFTYERGDLFLDGLTIGDAYTEALQPDTREALMRRSKAQEPDEPMTDARALREIEAARAVLEKHWDNGMLLGFWYQQYDGFQYRYVQGEYARRAEVEEAA